MRRTTVMLVLLAVSALGSCQSTPEEAGLGSVPSASAMVSAAGPIARLFANGHYVYLLEMTSSLGMPGATPLSIELSSELLLDARRRDDEKAEIAVEFSAPKLTAGGASKDSQVDAVAQDLRAPFVFTLDAGRLIEVRVKPGMSPFGSSIERTLAAAFQVAHRPSAAAGDAWNAKEVDGTGTYEAEYKRLPNANQLSKRRVRYEPLTFGGAGVTGVTANFTPEITFSQGTIALVPISSGAFRVEKLESDDKLLSRLGAMDLVSETRVRLSFVRQTASRPNMDWAALLARTKPVEAQSAERAPDDAYDSLKIGDYTFESALAELEEQAKDPKQNELFGRALGASVEPGTLAEREARLAGQSKVFSAMVALLRSRPKEIPRAAAAVRKKSPAGRPLVDALSSAGTTAAQHALVELMNDSALDIAQRRAAAFGLGRATSASPEAVLALSRRIDDPLLRVYSLYGLGTISRRLREAGATERSDRIGTLLVAALDKAETPAQEVEALRGIANSGYVQALAAVRPFFASEHGKVRVAAIDAVRLMKGPEIDGILIAALADGASDVQMAAVEAIAVREPNEALSQALAAAPEKIAKPATRLKVVRVMERFLPRRPELRTALEKLAASDASKEVQNAARAALASPDPAQGGSQFSKK